MPNLNILKSEKRLFYKGNSRRKWIEYTSITIFFWSEKPVFNKKEVN